MRIADFIPGVELFTQGNLIRLIQGEELYVLLWSEEIEALLTLMDRGRPAFTVERFGRQNLTARIWSNTVRLEKLGVMSCDLSRADLTTCAALLRVDG